MIRTRYNSYNVDDGRTAKSFRFIFKTTCRDYSGICSFSWYELDIARECVSGNVVFPEYDCINI